MTASPQELYHPFVTERHRIWERRLAGLPAPWSTDPVLRNKKFTNVYRVLDAGSQFLVSELLDPWADPVEVLYRCFLYRYTNRPEPWIAFKEAHGHYPDTESGRDGRLLRFWQAYQAEGYGVFSPAYKMFVGGENKGMSRVEFAVRQGHHITEEFSDRLFALRTMPERIALLQTIPRCKTFMSMQILTDIGYWDPQQDENAYILPGPGARAGVAEFAPGRDPEEVIRTQTYIWSKRAEPSLFGRPPSLMDVQNTFCEFSKYVRAYRLWEADPAKFNSRSHYRGHGDMPWPVLPAHWSLSCN